MNGKTTYRLFEPSEEWQEIPDGMAIPEGCDIRMNMETGKNEVKRSKSPHVRVMSEEERPKFGGSQPKLFSQEELGEALKNIKPEEIVTEVIALSYVFVCII